MNNFELQDYIRRNFDKMMSAWEDKVRNWVDGATLEELFDLTDDINFVKNIKTKRLSLLLIEFEDDETEDDLEEVLK